MSIEQDIKQEKFGNDYDKAAVNILFTGSWLSHLNSIRLKKYGITPEQYAQNTRELEAYSRVNAMGLQVYLQRQNQLAEQRRQDEWVSIVLT